MPKGGVCIGAKLSNKYSNLSNYLINSPVTISRHSIVCSRRVEIKGFNIYVGELKRSITQLVGAQVVCLKMYMNIDRYCVTERLPGGSQSLVYVAYDNTVKKKVVLKKVSLVEGAEIPSSVLREASLLRELRHQNIIRLDRIFVHDESVYMVLEYMEMDLRHHMKQQEYRYPAVIKIYLKQMLSAISYCHSHGVLHRDIKPENILVKSCIDDLKIADFGCARGFITPSVTLSPDMTTLTYRAPELLMQSNRYTAAVDIWSVGCVFAEMVYGNAPLFFAGSRTAVLDKIFGLLGTPNEDTWPGVSSLPGFPRDSIPAQPKDLRKFFQYSPLNAAGLDLLTRLLHLNPEGRITAEDALAHEYFTTP